MLKDLVKTKKEEGFTIIEVLIVLAIAGLILLIVLVAVPQLQKNQRNEARRSVLSRISTEINNFTGNNQGKIPTEGAAAPTTDFRTGFKNRYLGTTIADTFKMPDGTDPILEDMPATLPSPLVTNTVYYNAVATCSGEIPNGTGTARDFAIAIVLEGGAMYCVDNGSN